MKQRLTEDPDRLSYGGLNLDHSSPNASTFLVLNKKVLVYSYDVTHPMIFNSLKSLESAKTAKKEMWNDVGARMYPELDDATLKWYKDNWEGHMGKLRQKLQAGRIWEDVKFKKKKITVISFWAKESKVKNAINLIKKAYKLKGDIVVEYIDSTEPEVFGKESKKQKTIKSKKHPELGEQEIINILIKSHVKGYKKLTQTEQEVVNEFRGTTTNKVAQSMKNWGKTTPVEWHFYHTLGDNCIDTRQPSTKFLVELVKVIDNHIDTES